MEANIDIEMKSVANGTNRSDVSLLFTEPTHAKLWRKASEFVTANPGTCAVLITECLVLLAVFFVAFYYKRGETVKALVPADQCPSCLDCLSYSLGPQKQSNQITMVLATPSSDAASTNSYNFSYVSFLSSWSSCNLPAQDTPINLCDADGYQCSGQSSDGQYFVIPSVSSSDEHYYPSTEVITNVSLSVGDHQNCFFLSCDVYYGAGWPGTQYSDPGVIYGVVAEGIIVPSITYNEDSFTATCNAYIGGTFINAFTTASSVLPSNIITCTTPTNSFTALGTALSYTLSTFSAFKVAHYLLAAAKSL